jgi:hypothetical protein
MLCLPINKPEYNVDEHRQQEVHDLLLKAAGIICPAQHSISGLAQVLNVSKTYLYRCIQNGEVSVKYTKMIEHLTQGKVSRVSLNPRVFK